MSERRRVAVFLLMAAQRCRTGTHFALARTVAVGSALLLTLCLGVVAEGAGPPHNLLLARGRTEPVVAVDPLHPSIVVGGTNTNYAQPITAQAPGFFTSHNGGASFTFGSLPTLQPYTVGADPSIAIARSGTVFYSFLGETPSYCSGGHSAIMLTTSIDGGRSFRAPTVVDVDPADDKPYLGVESVQGKPAHVFLTWTRWHSNGSEIWYARSVDGGRSFSRPAMLHSSRLDNFGPVPLAGPRGRVYVFWASYPEQGLSAAPPTQIWMRRSSDDGLHFTPARSVVGTFRSVPRMAQPASLRNIPIPAAAVTPTGSLYLAWSAVTRVRSAGQVDADIQLSRSGNRGVSWSPPIHVNDARQSDRFMPSVSAFADGSLGIAFYDRRNHPWELDVYAARVGYRRHLMVSRNVRVNRTYASVWDIYYIRPGSTCLSPGRFFGDYIGTAATGRDVLCVAWADTQLHTHEQTDIWFARVKLPKVPRSSITRVLR